MSQRVEPSVENARASAVIERGGLSRRAAKIVVGAGLAISSLTTVAYAHYSAQPNGEMIIDVPAADTATTATSVGLPAVPESERRRVRSEEVKNYNQRLTDQLEIENQVAELVNYRLQAGEPQDVFWGRVSVYDTKAGKTLADITNPIMLTPRSVGWDLGDDETPYAVAGIVPGKPTKGAASPYQKITPSAYLVNGVDTIVMFSDYEGRVATYPEMDFRTLNVSDGLIRNQTPIARYDLVGDIFSLQFPYDGTAIGLMNPTPPKIEAVG